MPESDYSKLLKRVHTATATKKIDDIRFKVPKVDVFYEGNSTVLKNFDKIVQGKARVAQW